METKPKYSKYALINRQIELTKSGCISSSDCNVNVNNSNTRTDKLMVFPGSSIKIIGTPDGKESEKCIVQILDFNTYTNTQFYEIKSSYLVRVADDIWPFVISIANLESRLRLVCNKEQCLWLTTLKLNDLVSVQGELFKKGNLCFDCIVRYIGPVEELNPVGYFFGLEILHLNSGHSPQAKDIPFASKYLNCEPHLSIFATADWIAPVSGELKHKLSAKKFMNDTIERVYTAILPANLNLHAQRNDNKYKKRQPTAQFYDSLPGRSADKPEGEIMTESIKTDERMPINEVNKCNNKELKTYLSNFPASSERKSTNQAKSATSLRKNIASEKDLFGIKNRTESSVNERDIIIINKSDIEESTKNEHNVFIVNNSQDKENVDLADLLGTNWPTNAGGAGMMLNRTQSVAKTSDNKLEACPSSSLTCESFSKNNEKCTDLSSSPLDVKSNLENSNYQQLSEIPGTKLTIGSLVEVSDSGPSDFYGVIRWIGIPPNSTNIMVGIEVEDDPNLRNLNTSDGTFNGVRLFKCREGGAIFVPSNKCASDHRFVDTEGSCLVGTISPDVNGIKFGHVDCPSVLGAVPPLGVQNVDELEEICGKFKGIQGHHNSCYLDATLFSMFTFSSVFDSILYRRPDPQDISHYRAVQNVLRDEIVNPLRKNVFVRADRVMKLRKFLDQLSSVSGLTSEEKDPEEFLNSLLSQIMKVEPFLKLSSGQDSYFYQLFVEKDERLTFPTVQQLFEQSFHSSDIKLKEVPSCLIIQMPRFGKSYKMYPRILPSQFLDITNIIEDSPRECTVCGNLAEYECRECFGSLQAGSGLDCTAFCQKCLNTIHMHAKRANHKSKKLSVPRDFKVMADHMILPRLYMDLFAVVCIETSHYVAFVKAGSGPDAPWCFFDSMADRKGEKNGYNIPEMISVRELPKWLSDEGARHINERSVKDKDLPEHAKRLFCDAYMCMYQSTDVMMYH
ncbi:ubiquitin carboxyl-terminal hydrolase CYLD isoform X1 [Drosophila novamexicana]|uniref:ubiquitin carboxyl-terminal hydrolase CYLD isoform X1 n=1 Tax=Drosophila novamexicana TaxID=47314 RepID=UPI0011E5D539|nr:ubiquitin carboxyl-terminal hydrolase CYLD isoform X1 [Drosophila novamexicana]